MAKRIFSRFSLIACTVLLCTLGIATVFFSSTKQAHAATVCNNGDSITMGKYWLNSNLWGANTGSGSQCLSDVSLSGDTIAWNTSWNWTGQANSVKSYDSAVLGWHWGWKLPNTGLPVQLSQNANVNTGWNFSVTENGSNALDVAYDLWFHPISNPGNDNPSDEMMVWLYHSGGVQPVGSRQMTVTIGGTSWDLWRGTTSWNVFSFVRTSNTTSATLNLRDFTNQLVSLGWMSSSKYLTSVESGTEIFTGNGRLDTQSYYANVGGGGGPTPTPTPGRTPTPGVTPTPTPTSGTTPGTCRVSYTTNQWPGGFTANLTITNTGSTAINGWTLRFTFPGSQQVTQGWNGTFSQSGNQVTITNASYNSTIPPNGSVNPGFNGSWSGSNPAPTAFTLNGTSCSVA